MPLVFDSHSALQKYSNPKLEKCYIFLTLIPKWVLFIFYVKGHEWFIIFKWQEKDTKKGFQKISSN